MKLYFIILNLVKVYIIIRLKSTEVENFFYLNTIYLLIIFQIQHATETNSISKKAKDLLETLMDFDNIPRKRPKFMVNIVVLYFYTIKKKKYKVFRL